jgi:hypothetical protein
MALVSVHRVIYTTYLYLLQVCRLLVDEGQGMAHTSGAAGAADAVHVILIGLRLQIIKN